MVLGVEDLDAGRQLDVAGRDLGRAGRPQVNRRGLLVLAADNELLQVEDDVGHVLGDTLDRRELVQHAVDLHLRDGRARDRREKRSTQRVAERVAEAGLERLDRELLATSEISSSEICGR